MNRLDRHIEANFLSVAGKLPRRGLLRSVAVATGVALGFDAASADAFPPPECANTWGACGGILCCGAWAGCIAESPYHCGDRPAGCFVQTGHWSRCCNQYWLYQWVDCCFLKSSDGSCCGAGGDPEGGSVGCATCSGTCGVAYCNCYRCSYRAITANGC